MRAYKRSREQPTVEDIVEFFCLVGTYSTHRYSKTDPRTSAWGLALALEGLHRGGESHATCWLLIDASGVLRRLFQARAALDFARAAESAALLQDVTRIYPRALLNLATLLFNNGRYREAANIHEIVLNSSHRSPYQPISAYSCATALAKFDPRKAAVLLQEKADVLDKLPSCRQLQRFWTQARVLSELGDENQAFSAFAAALDFYFFYDHGAHEKSPYVIGGLDMATLVE